METVPYFVLAGRINYSRNAEMKQLEDREPLMYRQMMEVFILFVGQRVGFSIVSLQSKPWNNQSFVKQRAMEVLWVSHCAKAHYYAG